MKFSTDEMDDSRKLCKKIEQKIIPNWKQLSERNYDEERNDDKRSDKISTEECSKLKSTVPDRYVILHFRNKTNFVFQLK